MGKPGHPPVSRLRAQQETSRRSAADDRLLFQRNLAGLCRSTATGKILDCNEAFAPIEVVEASRDQFKVS